MEQATNHFDVAQSTVLFEYSGILDNACFGMSYS